MSTTIAVLGLWHLGCVTAACLADLGFTVIGIDQNVEDLNKGKAPLFEPGLDDLIQKSQKNNLLQFSNDLSLVAKADYVWVTYDTPVDDEDRADNAFVKAQILAIKPFVKSGAGFIISSQIPVGFTADLAKLMPEQRWAYSPENLRLGQALTVFLSPDRLIAGTSQKDQPFFATVFEKITPNVEWMRIESAEMVKHAINAFLATSVVFANELAEICEKTGADVKDVERGLKTEQRIGPKAYLSAGNAFSGGTLARDIMALCSAGDQFKTNHRLFQAVNDSNTYHKRWAYHRVKEVAPTTEKPIGILGLTYKPGTDTLRRSASLMLANDLASAGYSVVAFDPLVKQNNIPNVTLKTSLEDMLATVDCVVVMTPHPEFRQFQINQKIVIDPNGFLTALQQTNHYHRVGGIHHEIS